MQRSSLPNKGRECCSGIIRVGGVPIGIQGNERALVAKVCTAMPVRLVHIDIEFEVLVGKANTHMPPGLEINARIGVPEIAGVIAEAGAKPVYPARQ